MPDDPDDIDTRREEPTSLEVPRPRHTGPRPPVPRTGRDDRYAFGDQLGKGGMGEVVAARDSVFGREVAIKRMLEQEGDVDRFFREARIQGGLDHPSIPPVHELAVTSDGRPYFVMKRVAGTTLGTILQRIADGDEAAIAKFPRGRLLRAFAEVCLAVAQAHTRGVIHRDLKPSNVMVGELGEVYVLDWGVAKVVGVADPVIAESTDSSDAAITKAGSVVGTRGYMAPEQQTGAADVDARADVYALGCVLFELLTFKKHHAAFSRSPRAVAPEREIPPELDELCVAATQIDRESRLATARELGEGVQRYLDGDRDVEQRRKLAAEHLARARAVAESDADTAMREAGRALALDPSLPGAAELVGRLMIEPPKTLSPELARSLDDSISEAQGRHARSGARYAATIYIPLLGGLVWLEASPIYIVATILLATAMIGAAWLGSKRPRALPLALAAIAINTGILLMVARAFTPFLIAPGTAVIAVFVMLAGPIFRKPVVVIVLVLLSTLAILGPWLAEVAGWVSQTTFVVGNHVELHAVDLGAGTFQIELAMVLFAPLALGLTVVSALGFARSEDAARRQLHVQAWRLRQLVS